MTSIWMLAQAQPEQEVSTVSAKPVTAENTETQALVKFDPNAAAQPKQQMFNWTQVGFLVLLFAVMYLMLFRSPRKKQQEHKQMVQSLKKNDKVRTIGGIIGTVVEVKEDEIILKIDEANNTKIRIAPSAIGRNLAQENK